MDWVPTRPTAARVPWAGGPTACRASQEDPVASEESSARHPRRTFQMSVSFLTRKSFASFKSFKKKCQCQISCEV